MKGATTLAESSMHGSIGSSSGTLATCCTSNRRRLSTRPMLRSEPTKTMQANTIEQKRTYLTKIAQEFHALASESLRGRYHNTEGNDMRLRMKVQHANDSFANEMKRSGHSVPFAELTSSLGEGNRPAQPDKRGDLAPGALFSSSTQPGIVRPFCPQTLEQPFLPYKERDRDSQGFNIFQSIPFILPYMITRLKS